jgi:putative ATP-dependent endonuclease of the OLD family
VQLSSVRIQNFRCYLDRTVAFNEYTCFAGANGAGKSTILTALRILFRDSTDSPTNLLSLQKEDFYKRDTKNDVVITATFTDLDASAQEDFSHYVRQGELVISAVAKWDEQSRTAEVKQYGNRLVMSAFVNFFEADADGANVAKLKDIYSQIRVDNPDLPPPGTKAAMTDALHNYEAGHPEKCELRKSEDEFYGITKGVNRLRKYIEWVFIPAVKDPSSEQLEAKKTALGLLLERTVRSKISFAERILALRSEIEGKYHTLLEENQNTLDALSASLSTRLQEWAHPDAKLTLSWRDDPSKHISITEPLAEVLADEGRFRGPLSRFGHGLQRSFLLALLQELAGCGVSGNPRLLLACEEPELYQHPPQARHMSSVLQNLSKLNSQVIVSTHSPYFISGRGFEDVRVVRQEELDQQPCIRNVTFAELAKAITDASGSGKAIPSGAEFKVEQALQPSLSEMFFSPVLVLVEGAEDVAYVSTHRTLSGKIDEFRRLGCHIVPTSGKGSMICPLALATLLEIPTYVIFDSDGDDVARADRRQQHEHDNLALLKLCSVKKPLPFPTAVFQTDRLTQWPTKIGDEIERDFGEKVWGNCENSVRKKKGLTEVPRLGKNTLYIAHVLTELHESGHKSKVLDELCGLIISFAKSTRASNKIITQPITQVSNQNPQTPDGAG